MVTRSEPGRALSDARHTTDSLFELVRPDSLYDRPVPERNRLIFYLGHLEAFDWNLLARHALEVPAFHAEFDHLFAFGIDPPPGDLPNDTPAAWPGAAEVRRYNRRTREIVDEVLDQLPEELVQAAIEHRLMHAETFAYLLHQMPYGKKAAPAGAGIPGPAPAAREEFVEIGAGEARMGLERGRTFGWDNEFEEHGVAVGEFAVARYKVTNRQYLEFVKEGASAPHFWAMREGRWMYRGMFAEYPLPLDCPVYVTQEEASAYAAWRGMRLLTEPEFHRAAERSRPSANLGFRGWDPVPVTADDAAGGEVAQMTGNGWEWTSTAFGPFPGFEAFPFYRNYSEPFFDGRHFVLKGASPRTAACFLRPSFRNWFRPSYPYLYATFRVVKS